MTVSLEQKRPGAGGFGPWMFALGLSLALALLMVSPFFWRGNASGHDIAFHASSWLEVAQQWREGTLYPRWSAWANYGFGEPRFIFYPPLSWMLGAALTLVLPGNAVPGAFIVLVETAAGLSMFSLARRFFPTPAAVLSAGSYVANPYALLIIYMRSDFAELLAWAFLPALLLAVLQLCGLAENRWRSSSRAAAIVALFYAAIWLANAPAGVLATYSMALLVVWASLRQKSLRPLLEGMGGLALGGGLACFYLLPAAYEQRWVNIAQALSSGLQPLENFLYTEIPDPEHNLFNSRASTVAVLLIVLTGVAALLAGRGERSPQGQGQGRELWQALLLLGVAAAILMFRPTAIFWEYLPKLRFVQFPWRWMGVLALPFACFTGAVVSERRAAWMWAVILAAAAGSTGVFLVEKAWWDSDDIPSLEDAVKDGKGFEGTDEYDPRGDDHSNLPPDAPALKILSAAATEEPSPPAPNAGLHIERWTAENRVVRIDAPAPLRLALRLLDYPAWRVEVNGAPVTLDAREGSAPMIVPLRAGRQRVQVRFVRTWDRALGIVVSTVAGVALLACLWAGGARRAVSPG